ncbi:MAG: mannose-1-phosphate guanylyltransferase, partial [Actinobacteria bacterium]|nr:mannose-1-phosphate guanylyltransferase [Actinomycetota bacterium]
MIIVIIAGGSGTRLWPLSTNEYPKHLLSVSGERTLLQSTYDRASSLAQDIYVISETGHIKHVYTQLPDLPKDNIIVEPGRRGTASCVIAALAKIKHTHLDDEPIVFMHADHHIRDTVGFNESLQTAAEAAVKHQKIVLLGLMPTRAETGFGYIQRGEHANGGQAYDIVTFKEKPDKKTAQEYVESGRYLWNMGYFVAPLQVFEQSLEKYAPHLWQNYQKLLGSAHTPEHDEHYLSFKNEPIEYPLIEKVPDLLVVQGTFDWMDVGSYSDMHQVNEQDESGNTVQGDALVDQVSNSY